MANKEIILASRSSARQMMLANAGVEFRVNPADIDERQIEQGMSGQSASDIALCLAQEKAKAVSAGHSHSIVIGSDQVLVKEDVIYNKALDKGEAFDRLKAFQDNTHSLISSVAVAINGDVVWDYTDQADLTMKKMNDDAIHAYIESAGDVVTQCVGCYALESIGIRLFKDIKGNYFTILGMPLLPLLNYLEEGGYL